MSVHVCALVSRELCVLRNVPPQPCFGSCFPPLIAVVCSVLRSVDRFVNLTFRAICTLGSVSGRVDHMYPYPYSLSQLAFSGSVHQQRLLITYSATTVLPLLPWSYMPVSATTTRTRVWSRSHHFIEDNSTGYSLKQCACRQGDIQANPVLSHVPTSIRHSALPTSSFTQPGPGYPSFP